MKQINANSDTKPIYWWKAVVSIAVTLIAMPVTHIVARALKNDCVGVEQFYAGMLMGIVGLALVIAGVFIKGDVRQTLLGLFGGMFYWMGAVDFLFMYYANRFGTQAQLDPVTGEIVSRPEYLLLPATFGFWAMTMTRMLASATGDMMSEQLALDVSFGWDTESQAKLDIEKDKVLEGIERAEEIGRQVEDEQDGAEGNIGAAGADGGQPDATGNEPLGDIGDTAK